jgi:galactokinase
MDQMACASGGILTIDFEKPEKPEWRRLEYDFEKEGYELAIVDTGSSHDDLTEDYASVPKEMKGVASLFSKEHLRGLEASDLYAKQSEIRRTMGDRAFLRSLHFVDENQRVVDMVAALKAKKFKRYLKLVRQSGASSRLMLQNVMTSHNPKEQGLVLALALSERFLGKTGVCRVHGGGFAGTIQAYVPLDSMKKYIRYMEDFFGSGCVTPLRVRPFGAVEIDFK